MIDTSISAGPPYDAPLKQLLRTAADSVLRQTLGDVHVNNWINVELLPQAPTLRADLIGETTDGGLVHIELQSTNDPAMAWRMLEYSVGIRRQFKRFPKQLVLYVGRAAMRMPSVLQWPDDHPDLRFQYALYDFRDLDGSLLLESERIEANLLAILGRLRDEKSAIRQILERIAEEKEKTRRGDLLDTFLLLSGLRKLGEIAREEARTMPVLEDLIDHDLFGPMILKGRAEGRMEGLTEGHHDLFGPMILKGRAEGRMEGLTEGRADIVHRLLQKRFGPLPAAIKAQIAGLSATEVEDLALRILDAKQLDELFPKNTSLDL